MKLLLFLSVLSCLVLTASSQEESNSNIRLKQIDGRHWLISPEGKPFFAHGVTHINNKAHGVDVKKIGEACKSLGFNSYGYGCPEALKADMPYIEGRNALVPMSLYRSDGTFSYVDIFDPKEQAKIEKQIKNMCFLNQKNPNLIGYCWTDLAAWPLENSTRKNWVKYIRQLSPESPGNKAYQKFLTEWKGEDIASRDQEFLKIIAQEYFRVLGEANRKYDPDHLIFGDRFSFSAYDSDVIKEMLPYIDALAFQPNFQAGFPKKKFDDLFELTGKPIILCDFAIRFKEEGKNIRGWKPEENATTAGQRYSEYIRDAFATPYILGAFWCNPINSKPGFQKKGIKQGLFDQGLVARPGLNQAIRSLNLFLSQSTPKK